jgi:hypothetical protein
MNNNNRSADDISDELKFQPGAIYNSKVEMYADMRDPVTVRMAPKATCTGRG